MEDLLRKNWEKSYWKFRVVQFQRRLADNFAEALALPKSFVENVAEKMGENVILKTSSGAEWRIALVTGKDGNVFLKHGWKEFVKSHYLKKNDTLYFKYYYGDSKLEVTMFDGETSIEKACSHFVESPIPHPVTENKQNDVKYSAMKHRAEYNRRTHDDDDDEDIDDAVDDDDDDDDYDFLLAKNKKSANRTKRQRDNDSDILNDSPQKKHGTTRGSMTKERVKKSMYQAFEDEREPIGTDDTRSAKEGTMNEAYKLKKDGDVLVYMNPTCIEKGSHAYVSVKWARDNGLSQTQDVELHCGGDTLPAKFYFAKQGRPNAGIGKGWRQFVEKTGLNVGDVCIFNVLPRSDGAARGCVCIGVTIVRKVELVEVKIGSRL